VKYDKDGETYCTYSGIYTLLIALPSAPTDRHASLNQPPKSCEYCWSLLRSDRRQALPHPSPRLLATTLRNLRGGFLEILWLQNKRWLGCGGAIELGFGSTAGPAKVVSIDTAAQKTTAEEDRVAALRRRESLAARPHRYRLSLLTNPIDFDLCGGSPPQHTEGVFSKVQSGLGGVLAAPKGQEITALGGALGEETRAFLQARKGATDLSHRLIDLLSRRMGRRGNARSSERLIRSVP
jgi:hypothetical protein